MFPFIHLPPPIQTIILRYYVPFSVKVTVLCNMPEFAGLLHRDSPCWVHRDEALFDLLPTLSALAPGLYVLSDEALPDHGYDVAMDRENQLSFTLCMFIAPVMKHRGHFDTKGGGYRTPPVTITRSFSVGEVKHFLQYFLNCYVLAKQRPIQAYAKEQDVFLVNLPERKLLWSDHRVYDLFRSGNCCIPTVVRKGGKKSVEFVSLHVSANDTVTIVSENQGSVYQEEVLQASSLESLAAEGQDVRKASRYSFKISTKTNLLIETFNMNAYNYYKCLLHTWLKNSVNSVVK